MSRVCYFTGRKTSAGNSIARKGKAKYLGGVGKNITGVTKRKFKPNIQKVRAIVDGKICRLNPSDHTQAHCQNCYTQKLTFHFITPLKKVLKMFPLKKIKITK